MKNTLKEIFSFSRLPFSLIYLPVFIFSLSQLNQINWLYSMLLFFIVFVLVYGSSFMHQWHTESLIESPQTTSKQLLNNSIIIDILAVGLAAIIGFEIAGMMVIYIGHKRVLNGSKSPLKKFAILSYALQVFFHGAFIYILTQMANNNYDFSGQAMAVYSSCFIVAGITPLIQLHQHYSDQHKGYKTISLQLGIKRTFNLSLAMFSIATFLLLLHFLSHAVLWHFYLYLMFFSVSGAFIMWWRKSSISHPPMANFKNTWLFSVIFSLTMNAYFLLILFLK